ncbi:MAG: SMC-Scp complex subunit ScpB [Chthoniobacterales bacterium]
MDESDKSEELPVAEEEQQAEAPEELEPTAEEAESPANEAVELRYRLSQILEAILFASQKPLSLKEFQSICKATADAAPEEADLQGCRKVKKADFEAAIEELQQHYAESGRGFELSRTAAGLQLVSHANFAPWLRQLFPENRTQKISAPAMETLAIIAYRQPIIKADIEAVRGVAVDGVMQTLLDKGLVKIAGRANVPGRPLLYETTTYFMEHFGLLNLDELPNAGELRSLELPKAEIPEPEETTQELPLDTEPAEPAEPADSETESNSEENTAPSA